MYNFLVNATKNRLYHELKDMVSKHPVYKKLEVLNRFPYKERIQEGIIIKNSTASRVALSADNFQGNVFSYLMLGKHKNSPSLSIEWAREDTNNLIRKIEKEDVSSKVTLDTINLDFQFYKNSDEFVFANSFKDIELFINNQKVIPFLVDGKNKQILLNYNIGINDKVELSYYLKNLAPAGIYQIEITEGDVNRHNYKFMIDVLLDYREVIIESTTGYETSVLLPHQNIFQNSLTLYENDNIMIKDVDYLIDEQNGIITFIISPIKNAIIVASYKVKGISSGPYEIPYFNYANNTAIPGVILAFGRSVSIGDKQYIILTDKRDIVAYEYSGKWDMGFSLDVYTKDSYQIEEVIDLTTTYLNVYRKSDLDAEGIALVDVSFGGESEEIFDDATGDLYYKGSVDYKFLTEWIMHQPLILPIIEGYIIANIENNSQVVENIEPYIPYKNKQFERIF